LRVGEKPGGSLDLVSSGLDLPRFNEAVQGRLDGRLTLAGAFEGEQWQVSVAAVALQGVINELPAQISGFAGLGSGLRLTKSALDAQLNGTTLSLQTPGEALGPGHLRVIIEDIGRWQPASQGRVELQAVVAKDRRKVDLSASLDSIQWRGMTVTKGDIEGELHLAGTAQGEQWQGAQRFHSPGSASLVPPWLDGSPMREGARPTSWPPLPLIGGWGP
jgi:hypothetical protein